jgi:hypothetical protein
MTAARMSTDTSRQTLQVCLRSSDEIRNVSDRQACELMNQLVTALLNGVCVHQQGMSRALR